MCMCEHGSSGDQPPQAASSDVEPFPWHIGAFDVHCHCAERPLSIKELEKTKTRVVAVMATRCQDQPITADIAAQHGMVSRECLARDTTTVVPGFGRHPWFSHELFDDSAANPTFEPLDDEERAKERHYKAILTPEPRDPAFWNDLPTPIALSTFLSTTRAYLKAHPLAIIGEIGLDKAFRLPMPWTQEAKDARDPARTVGGRGRRPLSPHHVKISHQQTVLKAQLRLAGEMERSVSIHGVQTHGILYDILVNSWKGYEKRGARSRKKVLANTTGETTISSTQASKPFPPRICLHSFSGKSEAVRQYLKPSIPTKIFFSFSKTNNLRDESGRFKMEDAVKSVPNSQILVETDLHTAGERMDAELEETYRVICAIKGWKLEEGVAIIADNFRNFIFG